MVNINDNTSSDNELKIVESLSPYEEYRKLSEYIKETEGDSLHQSFLSIYGEAFCKEIGIDNFYKLANSQWDDPNSDEKEDSISILSHGLIEAGYITPILQFAYYTYLISQNPFSVNCIKYYSEFIKLLKSDMIENINNKGIGKVCDEFIAFVCTKSNDASDIDTDVLTSEFICRNILGIADKELCFDKEGCNGVKLPEGERSTMAENNSFAKIIECTELDKLINEKIIDKYADLPFAPFAVASLISTSVLTWLSDEGKAYVSKKYIIPYINKAEFSDTESIFCIICKKVVAFWTRICLGLTRTANNPTVRLKEATEELPEEHSFDEVLQIAKVMSFSDVVSTPCKSFSTALDSLFDFKPNYKGIDIHNTDVRLKAEVVSIYKERMLIQAEQKLKILHITCLFADNEVETAIQELIRNYYSFIKGRNHPLPAGLILAVFKAFYSDEAMDFSVKSSLYNIIKDLFSRHNLISDKFGACTRKLIDEIDRKMEAYTLETAKPIIKKIIDTAHQLNDDNEEIFSQLAGLSAILDKRNSVFTILSAEEYNNILNQEIQKFYEEVNPSDKSRDIYCELGPKSADTVRSYLKQSELIYRLQEKLKQMKWQDEIDYSAPVILMTKALEFVGNLLFSELRKGVNAQNICWSGNSKNNYVNKRNRWLDHITLGSIAFIFKNSEFLADSSNRDRNLVSLSVRSRINAGRFTALDGKVAYVDNNGKKISFTNNFNNNLSVLHGALLYLADNFRNLAAHCNITMENNYNKCKELMLTTQHLLWIFLYILEDNINLGN